MKLITGLGALFLYGSLGVVSGVGGIGPEPPSMLLMSVPATTRESRPQESTAVQAAASATGRRPVAPQEMSDDEKERRREECAREFEYCYDWCKRSNPRNVAAMKRCDQECSDKNTECMKKIPN